MTTQINTGIDFKYERALKTITKCILTVFSQLLNDYHHVDSMIIYSNTFLIIIPVS